MIGRNAFGAILLVEEEDGLRYLVHLTGLAARLERRRQTESHLPQSPPKRGLDLRRP
jgi:hypothetical protein